MEFSSRWLRKVWVCVGHVNFKLFVLKQFSGGIQASMSEVMCNFMLKCVVCPSRSPNLTTDLLMISLKCLYRNVAIEADPGRVRPPVGAVLCRSDPRSHAEWRGSGGDRGARV